MRKSTLLTLMLLCSLSTVTQAGDIVLQGKIEGIKKGRLYLLTRSGEQLTDTLGYCDFKRGKFALQATSAEPVVAQLVVEGFSGGFTLFAEPGVTYEANLSEGDSYYIRGGRLNEDYNAYQAKADELHRAIAGLQSRYDSLRTARKFRSASLVNDTLQRQQSALRELTMGFLDSNDNLIAAYTIYSNIIMREAALRDTRTMYASLGEGAKASQYGRFIKERILRLEKTEGGAQAPDFTLPDPQGNLVTMSGVEAKIKIIDFWASWCGPCRLNNPTLCKIYEEYHSKGLEIIGVSLDTNKAAWEKAIEKVGLKWINISSLKGWKCELTSLYNITGVPAIFILNENNQIIATGLKGDQLKAFLEERLK